MGWKWMIVFVPHINSSVQSTPLSIKKRTFNSSCCVHELEKDVFFQFLVFSIQKKKLHSTNIFLNILWVYVSKYLISLVDLISKRSVIHTQKEEIKTIKERNNTINMQLKSYFNSIKLNKFIWIILTFLIINNFFINVFKSKFHRY